jgi:hypothetical protein
MSPQKVAVDENDTVVVLGAVVTEPTKNIPGYTGKQPLIIWAGVVTKGK